MSKGDNSPGMSKLAGVIKSIAQGEKDPSLLIDFGVIQDDGSLLTNTYPVAIPASDYLVCRGVALPDHEAVDTDYTTASNKSHNHKIESGVTASGTTGSAQGHTHSVSIQIPEMETASTTVKQNAHNHSVDIARPSQRKLAPGDRVLVVWVQNDAVVVDIILSAKSVMSGGEESYG